MALGNYKGTGAVSSITTSSDTPQWLFEGGDAANKEDQRTHIQCRWVSGGAINIAINRAAGTGSSSANYCLDSVDYNFEIQVLQGDRISIISKAPGVPGTAEFVQKRVVRP